MHNVMHQEFNHDIQQEISKFESAKTEWDASDSAYRFVSLLQQTYHPFLWDLLKSEHQEVVLIAANALAVSLRGEGDNDILERIMCEVDRVDKSSTALPIEEREYLKRMLIDGLTMAEILSEEQK